MQMHLGCLIIARKSSEKEQLKNYYRQLFACSFNKTIHVLVFLNYLHLFSVSIHSSYALPKE